MLECQFHWGWEALLWIWHPTNLAHGRRPWYRSATTKQSALFLATTIHADSSLNYFHFKFAVSDKLWPRCPPSSLAPSSPRWTWLPCCSAELPSPLSHFPCALWGWAPASCLCSAVSSPSPVEALSTSCLHWALSLSGAPLVWPLSRVVVLFSQFSWTLEMGKELVVNLGHVLHLRLYSSYWWSRKRQQRRAFLKVVLFRSSTLSPSPRPQVTCSHPLCVWRWADSLLFTTNPLLPPGALRIHMEDQPDFMALGLLPACDLLPPWATFSRGHAMDLASPEVAQFLKPFCSYQGLLSF